MEARTEALNAGCYDGRVPEAIDDVDEMTVTMTRKDWQSVLESFEALPYPEDWADDGTLANEQDERIRQKLIVAGR